MTQWFDRVVDLFALAHQWLFELITEPLMIWIGMAGQLEAGYAGTEWFLLGVLDITLLSMVAVAKLDIFIGPNRVPASAIYNPAAPSTPLGTDAAVAAFVNAGDPLLGVTVRFIVPAGQGQGLFQRQVVQTEGGGDRPRIGAVDAVYIAADLTFIRLKGGGQYHCGGVAAAPAEGSDLPAPTHPLKTGHNRDFPRLQSLHHPFGAHFHHSGGSMTFIGNNPRLRPGE